MHEDKQIMLSMKSSFPLNINGHCLEVDVNREIKRSDDLQLTTVDNLLPRLPIHVIIFLNGEVTGRTGVHGKKRQAKKSYCVLAISSKITTKLCRSSGCLH